MNKILMIGGVDTTKMVDYQWATRFQPLVGQKRGAEPEKENRKVIREKINRKKWSKRYTYQLDPT